jgi:hypothetical protein
VTGDVKRVLGPLSPPPSAYTEDVEFTHPGGGAELRCVYERNGSMFAGGLRFGRVQAYRFRAEPYCTAWHIEKAYDTLVEIEQSEWIAALAAAEPGEGHGRTMRHFLIYIDGAGAYEVAADSCEWIPEVAVS